MLQTHTNNFLAIIFAIVVFLILSIIFVNIYLKMDGGKQNRYYLRNKTKN